MSNDKREDMLRKVRKLFAMGNDGRGNENETNAALRMASKIMAEYDISEAEVDLAALDQGRMEFGEVEFSDMNGREYKELPGWLGTLAVGVAKFTDTYARRGRKPGTIMQTLKFQGEKNDVIFAKWLYGVLVDEIQAAQRKSGLTAYGPAMAFRAGAAGSLWRRLDTLAQERAAARSTAAASGSRALVVVDRKQAEMATRFGEVKYQRGRGSRVNHDAHAVGAEAGRRINIPAGRPVGNETRGRLS